MSFSTWFGSPLIEENVLPNFLVWLLDNGQITGAENVDTKTDIGYVLP